MLPHQFKTIRQGFSRGKALAFMNIFGLFVGVIFFGLVAFYAANNLTKDGFHPDASGIFSLYEGDNAQSVENKIGSTLPANHTPTAAISLNNSTASSMVCTPSILSRNVFLTSFKLVRRGLACKNDNTCLNWSVSK